ncbi:hypothetical protein [Clostridium botulinum]|uniref:hypothetical protein n=1 Tax=Clostridium botulinum TaxID=1491 RepID=UPI0018FE0A48|nr:hypothetical protein [Clostridium botulinum]
MTKREEYEFKLKIIEQWIEIKPNQELFEALKNAQRELKLQNNYEIERELSL